MKRDDEIIRVQGRDWFVGELREMVLSAASEVIEERRELHRLLDDAIDHLDGGAL